MRLPVIGFINSASSGPFTHLLAGFRKGLNEQGFVDGQNVTIDARWAEDHPERLPGFLQELVQRHVAVVAITGGAMPRLIPQATSAKVPIVFIMGTDPVSAGLVASYNQPGGHITGVTNSTIDLAAKRLEVLGEILPRFRKIAVLLNPDFPNSAPQLRDLEAASIRARLELLILHARRDNDFASAFAASARAEADALLVGADPLFYSRRDQLVALAADLHIPAMYEFRAFAEAGGLMSYGTDITDAYRLAGVYAGSILKGVRPADLPIRQASKFELVINLKTAKTLGLDVPPSLLARADEVIE
jgi:putative ABC transport system substrate-binding protein